MQESAIRSLTATAFIIFIILLGRTAHTAETKVKPEELPKTVAETIQKRFPDSKLRNITRENVRGEVIYDIELTWKDRKYESDIKESGVTAYRRRV